MIIEKIEGYTLYLSGCKSLDLLNISIKDLNKNDQLGTNFVKTINHKTKIVLICG